MKFVFFVVFTAFYAALILKGSELVELTMPIILTIFLTLVIPIALILYFHKSSWDWLSDIVSKRIEALSSILTQQLLAMRDAIASQDKDTLVLIAKESSETFSKWYQRFLFRRYLIRALVGLFATSVGLITIVYWQEQNSILRSQLESVSEQSRLLGEQVRLQRTQWFLTQRTELLSILYDRVNCDKDPCQHVADLRTRTQAAITLVQVAQVEIKTNAILRTKRNNVENDESTSNQSLNFSGLQPESLLNLSYVELKEPRKDRQVTQGHGAYLARLDWSDVNLIYADLSFSSLARTIFHDAKLQYANLSYTNINETDFNTVFAMEAIFEGAIGINVVFENADLSNADFSNSNLRSPDFTYATLDGAKFYNATLYRPNFSGAHGLTCEQLEQASKVIAPILPKDLNCQLK